MQEKDFREYLEKSQEIDSKLKAVNSRISRANAVEEIIGVGLDTVVIDDNKMYNSLCYLKNHSMEHNGNLQNALRWYYKFKNGKDFPRLNSYCRS